LNCNDRHSAPHLRHDELAGTFGGNGLAFVVVLDGVKSVSAAIVVAAVDLGLSGCTVEQTGVIALTRNATGTVVADIHMCRGHVDGVTVYTYTSTGASDGSDTQEVGTWDLPVPTTASAQLALTGLDDALPADTAEADIYAWSTDNSSQADGAPFTSQELADMHAGQYWAYDWAASPSSPDGEPPIRLLTADEWKASVAAFCSDI